MFSATYSSKFIQTVWYFDRLYLIISYVPCFWSVSKIIKPNLFGNMTGIHWEMIFKYNHGTLDSLYLLNQRYLSVNFGYSSSDYYFFPMESQWNTFLEKTNTFQRCKFNIKTLSLKEAESNMFFRSQAIFLDEIHDKSLKRLFF